MDHRTKQHVLEALRAFASQRWHGRGCDVKNCGTVCLCASCHARVALERLENSGSVIIVEQTEKDMLTSPQGRWRILSKVSPSGKTMFVCLSCGRGSYSPQETCPQPVTMFDRTERACADWRPSTFEVQ